MFGGQTDRSYHPRINILEKFPWPALPNGSSAIRPPREYGARPNGNQAFTRQLLALSPEARRATACPLAPMRAPAPTKHPGDDGDGATTERIGVRRAISRDENRRPTQRVGNKSA